MNFDAATIERMVREVLSQTQAAAVLRPQAAERSTTEGFPTAEKNGSGTLLTVPSVGTVKPENVPPPVVVSSSITITDHIVTADLLQGRVKRGETVVVSRRAIITPSAQDYVRTNRVTVERNDPDAGGNQIAPARWRILVSGIGEHTLRAVESVCQQRSQVQREITGTAIEAAQSAVGAINRADITGAVIVARQPEVAACIANRQVTIRAAVVTDLAAWSLVQPQLRPNVVCLDPQRRSFMELQNILNKIVMGPEPRVPDHWI